MNKEKCYEIIDNCKKEIEQIVNECDGYDGNSTFLALQLIKDLDRLRKCISIDVPMEQDFYGRNKKGEYYGNRRKYNV